MDVLKCQFLPLKSQAVLHRKRTRENHFVCLLCVCVVCVHATHQWRFFKIRFVNISIKLCYDLGLRYTGFS